MRETFLGGRKAFHLKLCLLCLMYCNDDGKLWQASESNSNTTISLFGSITPSWEQQLPCSCLNFLILLALFGLGGLSMAVWAALDTTECRGNLKRWSVMCSHERQFPVLLCHQRSAFDPSLTTGPSSSVTSASLQGFKQTFLSPTWSPTWRSQGSQPLLYHNTCSTHYDSYNAWSEYTSPTLILPEAQDISFASHSW